MEVFEIFIIRYINYINIWSIELTNENFYEEFRDGILLVNLLKQWSSLYGYYNTEGDLVIYKRPLSRSQALNNINLCINFIVNPPEKSKLPEYLNREKELIKAEEIYDMSQISVIKFISTIFHHYLIPYLRLNSRSILDNMNKYLVLHGLSLSDETKNNFYKMIAKSNIKGVEDEEFLERVESWENYLSLNMEEHEDKDHSKQFVENEEESSFNALYNYVRIKNKSSNRKVFESKYINSLQCDITSNGFILIMVMLYQMGWIDTSILCQMYYVPKTLDEFKWNHEMVYYSFQTINNYLNIQKELSIINHHSSSKKYGSTFVDDENDSILGNSMDAEIPFILLPLSSLYMENFSPYVLLLQIEILYNLLTQQVDSNYDVTSLSSSQLEVYGPYQPISLELLDELTYKDDYPLNWTMGRYNQLNSEDQLEVLQEELSDGDENVDMGTEQHGGIKLGRKADQYYKGAYRDNRMPKMNDNHLVRIESLIDETNASLDNNQEELESSDDYVIGSMYEYLQSKEKEMYNDRLGGNLYDSLEDETEYDIGYNYNNTSKKQEDKIFKGQPSKNSNASLANSEKIKSMEESFNSYDSSGASDTYPEDNSKSSQISTKDDQFHGNGMDEMFHGLEKELEILKIYDKSNYHEKQTSDQSQTNGGDNAGGDIKRLLQEKMKNNTREFREKFSHILSKEDGDHLSKVKPLVSRTALEEQQRKLLEMSMGDDEYTSKVYDITRKQNDGVIEKISTAISENNKLLEKLKMSMNLQVHNSKGENGMDALNNVGGQSSCKSEEVNSGLNLSSKENIVQLNKGSNQGILRQKVSFEDSEQAMNDSDLQSSLKGSQKVSRRRKVNKVSFSDLVQMEVERTKLKS
ncbi:hypothetical protein OJ252_2018 [Cryptosporidium canis]|uniref:Calponin-homology (CH) domain-containing protein n=1 Tax=Cryptosporidium canis TaxID=195482 RepID=A0ABQ8P6D3_9CRYT|nr:hypothetical protein OJ252_2018 [Cryptosporidium canis]